MIDYQIQTNTRRCAGTGRELQPGERFFSVLLEEGGQLLRRDYSAEAWQGPPAGAFGFWSGRIPPADSKRLPPIDDEMLVECFQRLEGQTDPSRINFRYVVALLLMRRKRFRFEEAKQVADREVLVLRCARTREVHEAINPGLSEEAMAAVQEEVGKVLGWQ